MTEKELILIVVELLKKSETTGDIKQAIEILTNVIKLREQKEDDLR